MDAEMSSGTEMTMSWLRALALSTMAVASLTVLSHADDEKATKQLEKLDVQFVKALTELAKAYDDKKVPEAAHFFASCALGFGGKDEKLALIKGGWEGAVYLGKLRGGDPIKETAPITSALGSLSTAYKKILDPWIARARKNDLSESLRKAMLDTGVKYELCRGAHEYVQAVQRFNVLRKAMGLRAILWDYEVSRELIQVAWYTCESEDWQYKELKKDSAFYSGHVPEKKFGSGGPFKLSELPEAMRSFVLARQQILNPNARTLRLAHWVGGSAIEYFSLYGIPQLPYREDIPTPTQRFRTETLVKDWVDVEETIKIGDKLVPYVRYPYPSESDAPTVYATGRGATEIGWAESENAFRDHAGLPIMLRVFCDAKISAVDATLSDSSGKEVPCRLYITGDPRVELDKAWATLIMFPTSPLRGMSQYKVTIKCKLDETPFESSWTFKTRPN